MRRIFALLLLTSCTISQQQRLQEQLAPATLSSELKNRHFAQDALRDPPGLFSFEIHSLASPLATNLGTFPLRIAKADNIPVGERFLFASIDPLTMKTTPHFDFIVSEDGSLEIIQGHISETADLAPVVVKDTLKGQVIWLAAISREHNTCNIATYIPTPLQASLDEAEFTLLPTHRKGTHFTLMGQGLIPGEKLMVIDRSGERVRRHPVIVNAEGSISLAIEPIVLGKLGGSAYLTIARGSIDTRIDYSWGGELESESRKEQLFHPITFVANRDPLQIDLAAVSQRLQKLLTI